MQNKSQKIAEKMSNKLHTKVDKKFAHMADEKITSAEAIVITSHKSPDNDSISSVLAMYTYIVEYLAMSPKRVRMVYTGQADDRWATFKYFDKVEFVDDVLGKLRKADLLIMMDGSGWDRVSRKVEKFQNFDFDGEVICIDHHPNPDFIFDLHLVATDYTATAEIVYWLFYGDKKLSKEICETILVGILGDTGNFRFVTPEKARVFDAAKRLVTEGGIKVEDLQSRYESLPLDVYGVLGELMENMQVRKVKNWPEFVISFMTKERSTKNRYSDETVSAASEIFAQYLKSTKGYRWGFVATPRQEGTRISGRSLPNSVSVRDIMERMKIGGGHDRAAGGKIDTPEPEDAIKQIITWMKKNKPLIN